MEIADNVKKFRERLLKACFECGRREDDITVVPATKCVSTETVLNLPKFGFTEAGENRVQEFARKYRENSGLNWHIIGALQTNKVKYVVGKARMIQSVDRESLAREISRLSVKKGVVTDILQEVNIGAEQNKSGVPPEQAEELLANISSLPGIRIRGLMSVPPVGAAAKLYEDMYKLFCDLKNKYKGMDTLSMGMSGDFELAVKCGATMVRPGRVLFGERV